MNKKIPKSTKVVIIGGGVIGCSVAYHLTKFGWKDVILLERDQLTSGTTWHAAGLVSQLGPSAAITKIRKYSLELYKKLEKEVDHSAGLRLNGALSIAQTEGRWQELKRQATTAQLYCTSSIEVTINNASYAPASYGDTNFYGGTSYSTAMSQYFVDVTDVANVKVRFSIDAVSTNTTTIGSSTNTGTGVTFIRLGDT